MRWVSFTFCLLVVSCGAGGATIAEDTPPDLEELIVDTLAMIERALPAHAACLDDLTITHAWELDDRAEYQVAERTIVMRVPATAPQLRFSLVHEVAHHIDFGCGLQDGVRETFAAAQGVEGPWESGDSWQSTPAELFATAVATLVTGGPDPDRRVVVADGAMEVVEQWALGTEVAAQADGGSAAPVPAAP